MLQSIDIGVLAIYAFAVLGTLEWIKGFFKEAKSTVWRLLLPVLCILIILIPDKIRLGLVVLSCSQIGYDAFVALIKNKLGIKNESNDK